MCERELRSLAAVAPTERCFPARSSSAATLAASRQSTVSRCDTVVQPALSSCETTCFFPARPPFLLIAVLWSAEKVVNPRATCKADQLQITPGRASVSVSLGQG